MMGPLKVLLLLALMPADVRGNRSSYQAGVALAQRGISQSQSFLNEGSANTLIRDYTKDPGEMNENHPANHKNYARERTQDQLTGPRMQIDPNADSMFVNANRAVAEPDEALRQQIVSFIKEKALRKVSCVETRDEEFEVVNTASIDPFYKRFEVWQFFNHCPNHRGWGKTIAQGCQTWTRPELMHPTRNPAADYEEVHGMNWKRDRNAAYEDLFRSGNCRLKKELAANEGKESRMIPVEFYKKEETRDDWNITVIDEVRQGRSRLKRPEDFGVESFVKTQVYICSYQDSGNTCKGLRDQGGVEMSSACIEHLGLVCVKWHKVYHVPKPGAGLTTKTTRSGSNRSLFNVDGQMNNTTYADNQEGPEAIAKLQAVRDIGAMLPKIDTTDPNSLAVFSGQDLRCVTQGGRWSHHGCPGQRGKKDTNEQKLQILEREGKCLLVGAYDEKSKNIGMIIGQKRTVTSYCCYESILSKILHQGAIDQGLKTLGDPKTPNCGPLTLGQIQAINWERIDFGPFIADVMSRVNLDAAHVAQKSAARVQAHFTHQMQRQRCNP